MSQWQKQSNDNIAERTNYTRQRLLDLIAQTTHAEEITKSHEAVIKISSTSVTDALERFMLWVGNLGAMRGPATKLSLDQRLSAAHDIRSEILRQLDDIAGASGDCK
jgi:hypothetical protein